MPANLENLAVATGLKKVSFDYSPKERQNQRMFKLPQNCTHFTHQQSNAQNFPSQVSTVHELKTSTCSTWIQKRQRNQRSNCQHPLDVRKSKRISRTIYLCLVDYPKAFECMYHNKLQKIFKEMGTPDCLACLLSIVGRSRSNSLKWTLNN